jgi:hypothetical protein
MDFLFVLLNHLPAYADGLSMKVIVLNLHTKEYLAANGAWVADKAGANDFLTLLRAYHFARINTSRGFEVLLHCLEDDYCASIITGIGIANSNAPMDSEPVEIPIHRPRAGFKSESYKRFHLPAFDETRNYLN